MKTLLIKSIRRRLFFPPLLEDARLKKLNYFNRLKFSFTSQCFLPGRLWIT